MMRYIFVAFIVATLFKLEAANGSLEMMTQILESQEKEKKQQPPAPIESAAPQKIIVLTPPQSVNKMPPKKMPHVSRMPHIPHLKPLHLRDRGSFMSHPFPQKKTLPDSAVFPPTTKKNTG